MMIQKVIESWFLRIIDSDDIPNDIVAVNIGLFESTEGYCLYLTGSKNYDEFDDDWAYDIDYEPKEKYLYLVDSEFKYIKPDILLNHLIKIIPELLSSETLIDSTFNNGKVITIGFDDSSLFKIR